MAGLSDYADKIDEWHGMSHIKFVWIGRPTLWEYLGLTREQYAALVEGDR
jgi:hypothetical protein